MIDLGTVTRTCTEISIEGFEGYSISEPDGEDFPNNSTTRGYVAADGDPATGNIAFDDVDRFKVGLEAGRSYRIDLKGNEPSDYGGTLSFPGLVLFGRSGEVLAHGGNDITQTNRHGSPALPGVGISDRNGGAGNNARLEIDVHITGVYILAILSWFHEPPDDIDVGTYTIIVTTTN